MTSQDQASQPINAQQLVALKKAADARLTAVLSDIELRKWALEHACKVSAPGHALESAKAMHAFLIATAPEAKSD